MDKIIKIAIADDEQLFRTGMKFLLERIDEFEEGGGQTIRQAVGAERIR